MTLLENFNEQNASKKLSHMDSLNLEAGKVTDKSQAKMGMKATLSLAFMSIGVIYGDIGTSPLYVYPSIFPNGIAHKDDLHGSFALIFYTLLLIPMIKYVFIVLWANDNGDGGTFALYSLLCRYAKVSLIPNQQPEDRELSNYNLDTPSDQLKRAQKIKQCMESSKVTKIILFLVTILGVSMVIGDGVLTPCISVLSAVEGIKGLERGPIVGISIAILLGLFLFQQFGTDKVGLSFAPILSLWFLCITITGFYNLFKYDVTVLKGLNPWSIVTYFKRNGKEAWSSLGGVVMCITGAEAMFADLGHFDVRSVQIGFSGVVFPSLIVAYCGQTSYLSKNPGEVGNAFYSSLPKPVYWPMFVVAVLAAIIASQAMISGSFAIISQSLNIGCFPQVKVIHTSEKHEGQVYIPAINALLLICCVLVTAFFKTSANLTNAYGIAVVFVMLLTTCFVTLIMLVIWKTSIWLIVLFFVIFGAVEGLYLSSVLAKFVEGGYLPLAFSVVLMSIMGTWYYVHKQRYMFELKNAVSKEIMKDLVHKPNINSVPGIAFLYSELVQGVPPIFPHFISNIPSMHSVIVFVTLKSIPISKVAPEERFLFRRVEPREYRMFRCVGRYGYNDNIDNASEFEHQLVESLKDYIRNEHMRHQGEADSLSKGSEGVEEEIRVVDKAMQDGVVHLLGETEVQAKKKSSIFKRVVVNHVYDFLRSNFCSGEKGLEIPRSRLLKVGMTYEI